MKAIVYRHFGSPDVLHCEETANPEPREGQVLIRVRAVGLNPLDWKLMKGKPWPLRLIMGLHKPKHPGVDVAGEVESIGPGVAQFKSGDQVFGACRGALADYVCAPASTLAIKPDNVTFEQAASVPVAAWTALQGLRDKARIRSGETVLINGAAGGVGTFAVQFAKHFGAGVTGVCSTHNLELVRSIGADRVLDYTAQGLAEDDRQYDVILECVGSLSEPQIRRMLTPKGRCVMIGASPNVSLTTILAGMLKMLVMAPFRKQKIVTFMARRSQNDLNFIAGLLESGAVRPVIDRCYSMNEVAEAMSYLEAGHVRGKLVVHIA
ncbi:MAG TPA: NAD(P)-dependent alcohol dehydrogenase [Acidobacteriaceae bacterium]|nr:NAD(P)-dependent alcohol dehydrogenase [Acidobacteriaceae bacterium]